MLNLFIFNLLDKGLLNDYVFKKFVLFFIKWKKINMIVIEYIKYVCYY